MSYRNLGTIEIDFTGGDPYPYRPRPQTVIVDNTPPTEAESAVALVIGVGVIGLIGLAIWKAPKTTTRTRRYEREPSFRIRV